MPPNPNAQSTPGVPRWRTGSWPLEKPLHTGRDLLGLGFVREVGDEAAVAIEQIDDRGMVHQVGPTILARHLLEIDAIGAGNVGDLLRRAGEADEGRSEILD